MEHDKIKNKATEIGERINNLGDYFISSFIKKKIIENNTKYANSIEKKDLAKYVPRWLPDAVAYDCKLCNKEFGIFLRKHHCRFCGEVFCVNCCYRYESFVPFYKFRVRICEHCYVNRRIN